MEDQAVVLIAETDCLPQSPLVSLKLLASLPAQSCSAVSHLSMSLLPCLKNVFLLIIHPDFLSLHSNPGLLSSSLLSYLHPHSPSFTHCFSSPAPLPVLLHSLLSLPATLHIYIPLPLLQRASWTHPRVPSCEYQVFTLYAHRFTCSYSFFHPSASCFFHNAAYCQHWYMVSGTWSSLQHASCLRLNS